jgi:outer membrane cobalamin receptor
MQNRPVWFHPRRATTLLCTLLLFVQSFGLAQQPLPTASPIEAEVEQVVVSATRFDIPLDQSPATVSVIDSDDLEQKQI